MQQARNLVADEFAAVNRLIIDQLHSNVPLVENIGHYIVDAGGKRLRPLLCLLSAGTIKPILQEHITLAAVIEFIHTATLLHDDVVDISTLRRGHGQCGSGSLPEAPTVPGAGPCLRWRGQDSGRCLAPAIRQSFPKPY